MHLNSAIESHIVPYLIDHDVLDIPGIGRFTKRIISDEFVLKDHRISPPRAELEYDEKTVLADQSFIQYVSMESNISSKKAGSQLDKYGQSLLNAILNYDKIEIPSIGKLYQDSSDGIKFESAGYNFHPDYIFLPSLELKPVAQKASDHKAVIPAKIQAPVERIEEKPVQKTDSNAPSESIAAPIVASSIIAQNEIKDVNSSKKTVGKSTAPSSVNEPIKAEAKEIKTINDRFSKTETAQTSRSSEKAVIKQDGEQSAAETRYSTLVDDPYKEPSFLDRWLWPILSLIALLLICFLLIRWCTNAAENAERNKVVAEPIEETTEEILDENAEFLKMVENDPILRKYKAYLTPQILETGCVIIIGSFTKSRNAVALKEKIISAGLEPYTETYGDFTRVGLRFECADHDLIEKIKEIRYEFNGEAWYLYPDMEVPY